MKHKKLQFKSIAIPTALFCVTSFFTFSQTSFNWVVGMGGTGTDQGYAIDKDSNGNIYTVGSFSGTANFGVNFTSIGTTNGFLTKTDPSGNYVWAKHLAGNSTVRINDVKLDATGNIYMTGGFNNGADFDMGAGTASLTTSILTTFILKLDSSGNYLWAKKFDPLPSVLSNEGQAIECDASGNIYIAGEFNGTADFNPGAATYSLTSNGSTDVYVTKLDPSGNFIWAKQFGGSSGDLVNSIHLDGSGNVYTTGSFQGTVDFDPGAGATIYTANNTDIYISKLTSSGNFVYAKQIGGSGIDRGGHVCSDASENVYATGLFASSVDFDPGAGTYSLTASSTDIYVLKLDASGNFSWANKFGAGSGAKIALNSSNDIFITGNYSGTGDFNPGVGTYNLTSNGGTDVFISRLDNNGNFISALSIGGTGADAGADILLESSGEIYLLGGYNTTADFNPFAGTYNMTSFGAKDPFLLKLTDCSAPTPPTNTTSVSNLTICNGSSTTLSANSGTNTINWYATASSSTIIGTGNNFTTPVLSAGTYSYFAEASGCTISASRTEIVVTVLTAISSSISSQTNISCNAGSNGSATVLASGGAGSYTYLWAPSGGTSATATGLAAGSYTCTITDVNSCTQTQTVIITQPPVLTANSTAGAILCNGGNTSVTISATGGTPSYSGVGTFTVSAGVQTYTVTDNNGCTATTSITITEPTALSASSIASPILCNGGNSAVTVSATGGTSSYTGTGTFTVTAGSYSYTVTDVNGCSANTTINIVEPAAIASTQTITLCAGQSVTVGSNTYNTSGVYTDVLTAANGCDSTVTTNLTVENAIDVSTTLSGLTISAIATGVTYQWIDCNNSNQSISGETNQTFTATANGNYAVIVTQNSCSDTSTCVNIATIEINQINDINRIMVFPNPSNGIFTITGIDKGVTLLVYNSLGELVINTSVVSLTTEIDLRDVPNGIYILKSNNSNDQSKVFRLVKQ